MITRTHTSLDGIESGASYSDDEKYRYSLYRSWRSYSTKQLVFIMLNPSTATEQQNDPTVERCQRRTMMGEYYGVTVINLFAFRATDPKDMKCAPDPVGGYQNIVILQDALEAAQKGRADIICGWGTHGSFMGQDKEVLSWFDHYGVIPMALEVTKHGHPKHPLYVSYDKKPIPLRST